MGGPPAEAPPRVGESPSRRVDRRRRRHVDTRDLIVTEAIDIITTLGVGALSLGEIARRIGVRTPSIYTYVDSKADLYDELFRRGWQECLNVVVAHLGRLGPVTPDSDPLQRLHVLAVHDHQSDQLLGLSPIFVVDAWEHAYYLDHRNDKAGWMHAFWQMADWNGAEQRFLASTQSG